MRESKRVWISGVGVVTCVGNSADALWASAVHARSGITHGVGVASTNVVPKSRFTGRGLAFALDAAGQALRQSGVEKLTENDGIIFATTTGQIDSWDSGLIEFLDQSISADEFAKSFQRQSLGRMLDCLRVELGHKGPSMLVASACAASTQAIALGAMWIQQEKVKRCLVGGAETLCKLTVDGFKSLRLLSPEPTRPFDRDRVGINLSEGAGFLMLEAAKPVAPLACVSGYGFRTDAFHMTGPHPEGRGAQAAMKQALHRAGIESEKISWIHAHGTGSELNDLSEAAAVRQIFGKHMAPVTSTKWVHGHALGASGAIESVLCVEALRRQMVLGTGGLENVDPRIDINLARVAREQDVLHILKNTLGFGGANASLVLSHPSQKVGQT